MMLFIFCGFLLFAEEAPEDLPSLPETSVEDAALADEVGSGSLVQRLTEPFLYDREGKRDPFLLPETKEVALLPGAYFGPFLPLQEVELKNVVIKGIILDRVKPKAILEIPMGSGTGAESKKSLVKVSIGDYLGENFGVIRSIQEGKIIIVQTLGEGEQKSTSTITLSIRK